MSKGRFGIHGGQYIPETLMNAVIELEEAYNHYKNDPEFVRELSTLFNEYAGRPSRLYFASKMTADLGGAKIYLKREDLNHTGAHKINNVLGQALLAKKMGKTRLIAETGADPPGPECIPHAAPRSGSDPCEDRYGYAQRRRLRSDARVDFTDQRYPLLPGIRYGPPSVPDDRP